DMPMNGPTPDMMPPNYDPNFLPPQVPAGAIPVEEPSLIAPPGLQPPPPAPPLADPAVSRRGARTTWPTTSSPQQVSQSRRFDPNVQAAGYQPRQPTSRKLTNSPQPGYQRPSGTISPNSVR